MKWVFPFSALFLTSCAPYSLLTEVGVTNPSLGAQIKDDVRPLNALHLSARPTVTLFDSPYVTLDSGLGPTAITSPANAWAIGLDQHTRLLYKVTPLLHPYLISVNGVLYSQGWGGTDVSYLFSTQLGAGVQVQVFPRVKITLDYRWFHHSNGMTFHSDSFRQFFGLRTPSKNEGFENGGIFTGVEFQF